MNTVAAVRVSEARYPLAPPFGPADVRAENLVLRCDFFEIGQGFKFAAHGGQIQFPAEADVFRHRGVNQRVKALETDLREQVARFHSVRADVAANKLVGRNSRIFSQSHPGKLKFADTKSELDLVSQTEANKGNKDLTPSFSLLPSVHFNCSAARTMRHSP